MTTEKEGRASDAVATILSGEFERVLVECNVRERHDLVLEEGEAATLSAESSRFKPAYRELRPRSIEEVRRAIGVPAAVAEKHRPCGCGAKGGARVFGIEDLDSEDEATKGGALRFAHEAAAAYIMSGQRLGGASATLLDKYLLRLDPRILVAFLGDITVNSGATLTVAKNTHGVYANRIRMYGTGKIVCDGPKTFRCTSMEGKLKKIVVAVPQGGFGGFTAQAKPIN
jgi:hypothetical protein